MELRLGKPQRRREMAEMTDEDVGWLDTGVEIEGTMKVASGLIRLNTHFKGQIQCEGTILVNDQAEVDAEIKTKLISISGKVKGSIHAAERVEIKEHGVVLGDIFTPSLVIDPGGFFDGQCHMPIPGPEKQNTTAVDSKDDLP
jgi:cytoskeletal protein CcmA (bactofilin family)